LLQLVGRAGATVNAGVEVKLTRHPETEETVILCRSGERRSKEQAMHYKFSQRIEQALNQSWKPLIGCISDCGVCPTVTRGVEFS
jgi:hypothetical protein